MIKGNRVYIVKRNGNILTSASTRTEANKKARYLRSEYGNGKSIRVSKYSGVERKKSISTGKSSSRPIKKLRY